MILNFLKKFKKDSWNFFRLQIAWNGWLTQTKQYVAFFPWFIFFHIFQGFSERISCDSNPEVWTEEMKLFALHISTLQSYDLLIPFLSFLARIRIRKFMLIRTGQKTCWSVRIRIRNTDDDIRQHIQRPWNILNLYIIQAPCTMKWLFHRVYNTYGLFSRKKLCIPRYWSLPLWIYVSLTSSKMY